MYKKMTAVAMVAALAALTASADVIFSDDFEAYAVDSTATAADLGNNWFPSSDPSPGSNVSRIFGTGNYGGSTLWISLTDGTSITSRGIAVESNTNYVFSANLVAETTDGTRGGTATVDILLGTDVGTATSLIGGPASFIYTGDDVVIDESYADQVSYQNFSTGTVGAGEELFLVITRFGPADGLTGAFFGVDNVDVSTIPEPATFGMMAAFGGAIMFIRRKMII